MPRARLSLEERQWILSGRSLTGSGRSVQCAGVRATPEHRGLVGDRALDLEVERRLQLRHSPQQITNRLRPGHPGGASVSVP